MWITEVIRICVFFSFRCWKSCDTWWSSDPCVLNTKVCPIHPRIEGSAHWRAALVDLIATFGLYRVHCQSVYCLLLLLLSTVIWAQLLMWYLCHKPRDLINSKIATPRNVLRNACSFMTSRQWITITQICILPLLLEEQSSISSPANFFQNRIERRRL